MPKKCLPILSRGLTEAAAHAFLRHLSERTEEYIDDVLWGTGVTNEVTAWVARSTETAARDETLIPFRHAAANPESVGSRVNLHIAGWTVAEIAAYDTEEVSIW
ncbi:hypothetical protein [Hoeflea sp.]|uniref:hypothetical protein n=1 Tax=Hoeflea sp. TaxID=1940281 RepID=UPI001992C189|nr:hypothetical protein [Hoeflea sp.]MBC7281634.1 hypothetical protein [Hoeflea sp.]